MARDVRELIQLLVALLERVDEALALLFCALAVVDVRVGAEPTEDFPVLIPHRQCQGEVPPVASVRGAEAELHLVGVPGGQRLHPPRPDDGNIVRMQHGAPS